MCDAVSGGGGQDAGGGPARVLRRTGMGRDRDTRPTCRVTWRNLVLSARDERSCPAVWRRRSTAPSWGGCSRRGDALRSPTSTRLRHHVLEVSPDAYVAYETADPPRRASSAAGSGIHAGRQPRG